MEIYLIRHTTPAVEKGICYGQSDLDVTATFLDEATKIKAVLPKEVTAIYSSPLQRCTKLAVELFPSQHIHLHPHLKELNCGIWELQKWDDIPAPELKSWMDDFVNVQVPDGESYTELYDRVVNCFNSIIKEHSYAAIVCHAGVVRSILSFITGIPLKESFNTFKLHYGCVVKLTMQQNKFEYEMLHNIPPLEKEQHRPSNY
ncbi:MAG: alpha-ribazole phosphatase family protein [Panacibacter sp.]